MPAARLIRAGLIDYQSAWELQRRLHAEVVAGADGALILCAHPHVYTLGKQTKDAHLPMHRDFLLALGSEVVDIDRGGSVTYHGPGQIIGYPILDLGRLTCGNDLHLFLRALEEALIVTAAHFGINAWRVEGKTGVWTQHGKVAAIGLRCSRWVSMHGFALNVDGDLSWFDRVVPCGLTEPVTSFERLLGSPPDREEIEQVVTTELARILGLDLVERPIETVV